MINRYRDHAANERTYLAWVRTGITVMMLGFFVEKFELFLSALAVEGGYQVKGLHGGHTQFVSLALIVLGMLMIAAATVRFFVTRQAVEHEEQRPFRGVALTLMVSGSMVAFGIYLLAYLSSLL